MSISKFQGQSHMVDENNDMAEIHADTAPCPCRARLNHAIQLMLSNQEESGFPHILRTIERKLRQYQLRDRLSSYEVFNEACNRAIKKCEKGEEIPNISAWFRTTCFYVISEKSREFKRIDSVIQSSPESNSNLEELIDSQLCNSNSSTHLDILEMLEIYQQLPELEQKILYLQASGLSWEEVADQLIESGEQEGDRRQISQAIAQRASRARKQLRKQYYD
jgi:DNA-directed RNA polymerase specialized sigma24 family protein